MRFHFYTQVLALMCLSSAISASADAFAEQASVTIYSDVVGAEDILDKQYATAIGKILSARSENPIFSHNNLCIAYLLSEQFSDAQNACIRALKESGIPRNYGDRFQRNHMKRVRRQYRERAFAHLKLLQSVR